MNARILRSAILLLACVAVACDPSQSKGSNSTSDPAVDLPPITAAAVVPGADFTIGDIETSLSFELRPRDDMQFVPGLVIDEMVTGPKKLAKITVTVGERMPTALPFTYTLSARKDFQNHAIQVFGKVKLEGREVGTFNAVLGKDVKITPIRGGVDIIGEFETLPDGCLLTAEAELIMFRDTDSDAITIDTPPQEEAERVGIYSNPVRIEFGTHAGTNLSAQEEAPTEETASDEVAETEEDATPSE